MAYVLVMFMDPAQPAVQPAAWHHATLHQLADLTLELAQAVQRQALREAAATPPDPAAKAGLLFTRIARTLRQIVALDGRIAADRNARSAGSPAEHIRRAAAERARKHAARRELGRRLRGCIDTDATPRDTDALFRDLDDRLYDDDIDAALGVATVTDIVLTLCAEFGLKPDYARFTDEELGMDPDPPLRPAAIHPHPS